MGHGVDANYCDKQGLTLLHLVNGEISNHEELRSKLKSNQFNTGRGCEVIAHLVVEIPDTFDSLEAYLSSFVYPLLEEVRADFCSCLEAISKAPFINILSVKKLKPLTDSSYCIRVGSWLNGSGNDEVYEPKKGDLFVLSDVRPTHSSDLNRYGNYFNLALVTKGGDDDLPPNIFFKSSGGM